MESAMTDDSHDSPRDRGGDLALGIDFGTTAVKAMVVDEQGREVALGSSPTRLITGANGLVEQDPEEMWQGGCLAVRDALSGVIAADRITSLSLSSQGGTLIITDEQGHPLANAFSWMDTRPNIDPDALGDDLDADFFRAKTGWELASCLPLAQLIRIRRHRPELLEKGEEIHFVDSWCIRRMTGRPLCNPSDAAITMLYDVGEDRWDERLMELAGVERSMLPPVEPSGTVAGELAETAADELGLDPGLTVVSGAHDQYCAAHGAGCREAGDTIISCGTAWVLLAMTDGRRFESAGRLASARAITPGLWGLLGSCPTAGASVDWFRGTLSESDEALPFEDFQTAATGVTPSEDNPVFLPPGGRNDDGRLVGLSLHHGRGELARAAMEGAAMSARVLLDEMKGAGASPRILGAVGGATRSAPWMQIIADVTNLKVEVAGVQEAASYGAALVAGTSTGLIEPDAARPPAGDTFEPRPDCTAIYDKLYRVYQEAQR